MGRCYQYKEGDIIYLFDTWENEVCKYSEGRVVKVSYQSVNGFMRYYRMKVYEVDIKGRLHKFFNEDLEYMKATKRKPKLMDTLYA